METLAIVLLTANTKPKRLGYAEATLTSTLERLRCTSCNVKLHIGDDGSGSVYQNHLRMLADECGFGDVTLTDSGRTGYGANYNLAMQYAHNELRADYLLPLEDDWELNRPSGFDVDPIIQVLRDGVFDSVRLGYIGYTQKLVAEFVYCNDRHWLLLDPELSHEPHVFSGHPRIETVAYQQRVGPWPTGLTPGETEWAIASRPEYRAARSRVAWPIGLEGCMDMKHGPFEHIGTVKSY